MSLPTTFPTCSRYDLHPCERNEQIAALAVEIEAVTGARPAVACWAATQELTAYDVLSGWDGDPKTHLDRAEARVIIARRAAQAQKRAA